MKNVVLWLIKYFLLVSAIYTLMGAESFIFSHIGWEPSTAGSIVLVMLTIALAYALVKFFEGSDRDA